MATDNFTPAMPQSSQDLVAPTSSPSPASIHKPRRMKVGYIGPSTPYLRLQGRWLERAGFPVGTPVCIGVMDGCLVVEAIQPEEPPRCAEPDCPHEAYYKLLRRRQQVRPREWEWRATLKP